MSVMSAPVMGLMTRLRAWRWRLVLLTPWLLLCLLLAWQLQGWGEGAGQATLLQPVAATTGITATAANALAVQRGQYLARLGNCQYCHTRSGSAPYAGGRAIETPFGAVYASNLTPDPETGLGRWTADDFWRALHHGRSRDGRLLNPAFPYTSFTRIRRADADDLFAYLRSLPAHKQAQPAAQLPFPLNTQTALALWRALFFRPVPAAVHADQSQPLRRGAYLVQGLGHCAACHAPRNALGGQSRAPALSGGYLPGRRWYAPALNDPAQAGVADWPEAHIIALLQTGVAANAQTSGPMAAVVRHSLQYLTPADAQAMAQYLRQLPQQVAHAPKSPALPAPAVMQLGAQVYQRDCADCHGAQGQGRAGAFPALAGNRAVLLADPANLLQTLLHGGYPPATSGNPQPYGMPPLVQQLSDPELAAVASYIRNAWGQNASAVDNLAIDRAR